MTSAAKPLKLKEDFSAFFRFRRIDDDYLVVSETGQWLFLKPEQFEAFVEGTIPSDDPLYAELSARNLLRATLDEGREVQSYREKNRFVLAGPNLHIVIVTLRCNERCVYCHASRKGMDTTGFDMTPEVADRTVDLIFETTSPEIVIEFQGGEPLANFPIVQRIIERATTLNAAKRKTLSFSLVSNLSLMDEEKLTYLLDHHVQVCTSIDGPEDLHDENRKLTGGSAFAETVRWIKRLNDGYIQRGLDPSLYHVEALLTVTRASLTRSRDIVDTYLSLGCRAIFLRPLNPFGFARSTWERIGYTPDEFIRFYRETLQYIIEINRGSGDLLERFAAIFLTKILTPGDPNFLDIRSPCGAGVGQVAYNFDGAIFTCDEGRMIAQMGDNGFQIGNVLTSSFRDAMDHDVVKALAVASCLDGIPGCIDCAFKPFCGTCPVYNYTEQGNIVGQMPTNSKCRLHMAIMDDLFRMLRSGDDTLRDILARWTRVRDRQLFYQPA